MTHSCTITVSPPAHELPFTLYGRQWVALLFWCDVDSVWDCVVYETKAGGFRWECSGVALKRFVRVDGREDRRIDRAVTEVCLDQSR
jgi:hypothetical protein